MIKFKDIGSGQGKDGSQVGRPLNLYIDWIIQ